MTWLYGPLQEAPKKSWAHHQSEPQSHLSKNNSFINKKPILKKRSMSEVMLQKSISASSLLKQAAAAVQAQQNTSVQGRARGRPILGRVNSDVATSSIPSRTISRDPTDYFSSSRSSTSGVDTPELEKKHIRFDDKVEQCIAVDCQRCDYDEEEDENSYVFRSGEDDDSDEGVVMMKKSKKRRQPKRTSSRGSATSESKTIAKLPSTTLKYRTDSPDMSEQHSIPSPNFFRSSKLSPSPSQETLRPTNPSRNFLIGDDDDDDMDVSWEPSGAFSNRRDSVAVTQNRMLSPEDEDERREGSSGLRRTPSGMFMPYEDDEDDIVAAGLFGKVVDTVNTAKDIAHVIWNVGWRR